MKKIFVLITILAMFLVIFSGCGNQQVFDTTYTFNRAVISLPNGEVVDGKVSSWKDYEDSDQIQVVVGGKTYFTHSTNVVLIAG